MLFVEWEVLAIWAIEFRRRSQRLDYFESKRFLDEHLWFVVLLQERFLIRDHARVR